MASPILFNIDAVWPSLPQLPPKDGFTDLFEIDMLTGLRPDPYYRHILNVPTTNRLHAVIKRADGVLIQVYRDLISGRLSFRMDTTKLYATPRNVIP
jgi:hypothetical protein